MIRLRRNCSDDKEYLIQTHWIGKRFEDKGYNKQFIEEKIQEVYEIPRNLLIQDKNKDSKLNNDVPLITPPHKD